jgi:hypothetical protein
MYSRVIPPAIIVFIFLFLVGLGFNLLGAKGINLFFSLVLVLITLACSLRAEAIINIFFAGVVSGIIQTPQTMPKEIKKFFNWYVGLVGQIMLWTSIVFFFLGTLDASGHTRALMGLLVAIILIQLIQAFWKIGKSWGKQFVYYYTFVMLLVFAFSFIPDNFVNCEFCKEVKGFIKTQWSKIFQNSTTYQLPAGIKIYNYTDGVMTLAELEYTESVEAISLNETEKKNGAIFEKVGLPDPTSKQPGAIIGWIFSGDLKSELPRATPTPTPTPTPPPLIARIDKYVIPVIGNPPYFEKIEAGEWIVSPKETAIAEVWDDTPRVTNGLMVGQKARVQKFFPPIGATEITLVRKK